MSLRETIITPLVQMVASVRRDTGTTPMVEVYIHSAVYDALVGEHDLKHDEMARDNAGREGLYVGGFDIVIRPQRAYPR